MLEGLEPVRRRPGMYIGGTDEKGLHHLFAEVIDNCMDEAVAGHASWIEVEVEADGFVTVTDNGRGIPVDTHPKFKNKSALEVIMTTLHSGGKFDSKVYETSGGLHGVGVSVVNALSETLEVEVARGRRLYAPDAISRGEPTGPLKELGEVHNRRGTRIRFHPDPQIFGKGAALQARAAVRHVAVEGLSLRRRRDPLVAARRNWSQGKDIPEKATFHFPGGLSEYLAAELGSEKTVVADLLRPHRQDRRPRRGGMGGRLVPRRRLHPLLLQHHPDRRRRHPRGRLPRRADPRPQGLCRAVRQQARQRHHRRRRDDLAAGLLSVFIREPEFVGQTKDRLSSAEATRIVENAVRDPFDHWLAASPADATRLLDWVVERAEERLRRRQEKEIGRQSATRKLRLPGKLADCTPGRQGRTRSCSSSRAIRPAARPSRRATAPPRRSCR